MRPSSLQETELNAERHVFDLETLIATARKENRPLTPDEEKRYVELRTAIANDSTHIASFKAEAADADMFAPFRTGKGLPSGFVVSRVGDMQTFGQRFVYDKDYTAWLKDPHARQHERWSSPVVEIPRVALTRFATLTEDPASGGALVVPDHQPGIVSGPVLPVVVADLFAPGTTTSNSVPTMLEKSYTNAAAPTAEGQPKPESTLVFEAKAEPVKKIAHWIGVTEELIEDQPATASYIDTRLRYGVLRVEDQQLLSGSGVGAEIEGILLRPGLAPAIARVEPASNADVLLSQIVTIESTTGLAVSGIVMNPAAWGSIIGSKDSAGAYLASGPFGQAQQPMLWGRQVALTDQIAPTEALVGAFKQGGQVFRRGGIRVQSSNSHEAYFVENKVAIRAEERLALAVYRPSSFGKVTGLTVVPVVVTP